MLSPIFLGIFKMTKSMYKNNFYPDHISESRHIAAQAAAYNYLYRKSAWARWFRLGAGDAAKSFALLVGWSCALVLCAWAFLFLALSL
jgi:hypothetical protein